MRHALCQHAAHDKISALGRVCRARPAAQGEHLHARECRFWIGHVFALAPRDVRDRPQHDDGRDRQLDRKRGQAEGAASGPGGGGQRLVQDPRGRAWLAPYRSQRRLQRHLERCGRGGRDRLRGWGGKGVADELDRLAREHG
jgi:hypothetical protein